MRDFVALDFETANYARTSACSIGLAVVRNGAVAEVFSSLIRPPTMEFRRDFTAIHGLTAADVADAPTFDELWPEIHRRCDGGLIAAHNAAFDISVLRKTAEHYRLAPLAGQYVCTLRLAKALLSGMPNYKLNTLADHFAIPLNHHEATSDAIACAELGLRLAEMEMPAKLETFYKNL